MARRPKEDPGAAVRPPRGAAVAWHTLSAASALARLETSADGLTGAEARRRLERSGPNELVQLRATSAWATLRAQLANVLVVLLLAATAVSASLGHTVEAVAIAAIVLLAVALGFVQEHRAERAILALRRMAAPTARALRDGALRTVPARELVPGDVVELCAGDRVPADARLSLAVDLSVDEAALTGESVAVQKRTEPLQDARLPLGDRTAMVYAGTLVTRGRARAAVVATGMETEFGQISGLVQTVEASRTPLQEELDRLGRSLGIAALVVVAAIVLLGLARGMPLLDMLLFGVALAVAVVPEALPAVVTVSLAIGVRRMLRRNALVRRLPVVETLGSTSVICSDKTGTLTRGEMTVRRLVVADAVYEVTGTGYAPTGELRRDDRRIDPPALVLELLQTAALVCDARVLREGERWRVEGDPTEGAIVTAALKAGLDPAALAERRPRVGELPFTSERKRMTTLHETPEGTLACSKGAAEEIAATCSRELGPEGERDLDTAGRERIQAAVRRLAGEGLRVLAVARKHGTGLEHAERAMTFLGLLAMMDPPRPEARRAIEACRRAGITAVMMTGDHPLTARAVAAELGLLDGGKVLSASDLEGLSDEDLAREAPSIRVVARVSPADKLRVVRAWQARGEVVAVTGDGINDAPALKQADVGVAMGITGTDVSKEAAAMTLLDDDFASIVAAVEEGRTVFGNIRKYLTYLLSSNTGEILLMAAATLAGLPLPLSAVQLLYVNLATDGLPALALAVDPAEPDLMRRPPRAPRGGVFTRRLVVLLLAGGIWSGAVNAALFAGLLRAGRPLSEAMATTFVSLVLIQFLKAYCYRSDRRSVAREPFANRWLNAAVAWELVLLALLVYVPALHEPFGTFALAWTDWALAGTLALTVVPVLELAKWMGRRGWLGRHA